MAVAVILLVEDDEDVRDMLEFTLKSSGHVLELANHGRAALDALERQRPCLIILDLLMPVMTGWQVLVEMKQRKLDDIPVCVISALGERIPPEAIASLRKPFDAKELLAIAARYCSHASPTARG